MKNWLQVLIVCVVGISVIAFAIYTVDLDTKNAERDLNPTGVIPIYLKNSNYTECNIRFRIEGSEETGYTIWILPPYGECLGEFYIKAQDIDKAIKEYQESKNP